MNKTDQRAIEHNHNTVKAWLLEQNFTIEERHDQGQAWAIYATEVGGFTFALSEPISHTEVVALAVTLSFQDYEHELNRLLPNERREFIQDLWFKLLEFDVEFRPIGEPPDSVMIGIHLYIDELKRGPFWRAVHTIKRAVWTVQWTLQRKFIDPSATSAVN